LANVILTLLLYTKKLFCIGLNPIYRIAQNKFCLASTKITTNRRPQLEHRHKRVAPQLEGRHKLVAPLERPNVAPLSLLLNVSPLERPQEQGKKNNGERAEVDIRGV
jgi:hypothetical protein